MQKTKKVPEAISGRDNERVRQELINKTRLLYCNLKDNYAALSKSARSGNVRQMLESFAKEAERDCREIESISPKNLRLNLETAEMNFGMFRQLLSVDEASLSDEEKVLIKALKLSDNLRNVFSIMSKEYTDSKIRSFFEMLSKHEIYRGNELEQLYDDLIVRGEW